MPDQDSTNLQRRIARLEALIGVMVASEAEGFDPQLFAHILARREREYPDWFWEELMMLLRRSEYGAAPRQLRERVAKIESEFERRRELQEEIEAFQQTAEFRLPELGYRFREAFREKIPTLENEQREMKQQFGELTAAHQSLKQELYGFLAAESLGLDSGSIPLQRLIRIRAYSSSDNARVNAQISDAVMRFCDSLGLAVADNPPAVRGSWWKGWMGKTKAALTRPEVTSRLEKGERALELTYLQRQQAAVDKDQAEGAAALLKALDGTPRAVCQIGSILVLKLPGGDGKPSVVTRTLTQKEMILLEQNQHLMKSPEELLRALSDACAQAQLPPPESQ